MVQFKKLLPTVMRSTRWGDLASVIQNIDKDLRSTVINPIYNRFTQYDSTAEELIENAKMLGFNILSFENTYTSTLEYLRREVETITSRIKYKNSRKAYQYTSFIYGLYDEVYPIMYNSSGKLLGKLNTLFDVNTQVSYATIITDQEGDNLYFNKPVTGWTLDSSIFKLDQNVSLDYSVSVYANPQTTGLDISYTDTDGSLETDAASSSASNSKGQMVTQITRNVLYSYYFKFLESPNEWLSSYSLKSLKNDVDQIHKATEVIYYEPWMKFETSSVAKTITNKTYYSYDLSLSGEVNSILEGSSLLNAQFIQFGNGNWFSNVSGLPNNISGVQNFSYCIPSGVISGVSYPQMPSGIGGWSIFDTVTPTHIDFDFILSEKNKFTEFTELSILDSNSGIIYYAAFPKVQWYNQMYNNIRVQIDLV